MNGRMLRMRSQSRTRYATFWMRSRCLTSCANAPHADDVFPQHECSSDQGQANMGAEGPNVGCKLATEDPAPCRRIFVMEVPFRCPSEATL